MVGGLSAEGERIRTSRQRRQRGLGWRRWRIRWDPTQLPPVGPGEASRVQRPLSTLDDLVFGKDRLSPLERVVDRLFRRYAVVHHVKLGDAEDVLGVDLRDRRVVGLVDRQRRTDQRLLSVRGAVRVFVEPKRIALGNLGHRDRKPAKAALQIYVQYL